MLKVAALLAAASLLVACSPPESSPSSDPIGSSTDPIVGGIADNWRTYVVGVGNNSEAFCTGTVISRRTVLTAGHCWGTGQEAIKKIFLGDNINSGAQTITVAQAIRHPLFNRNTLTHDLTILQLAADAPTQPVGILRETMDNSATWVGPNFTYVGYGVSNGRNQTGFGIRRVTAFPIDFVGPGMTASEGDIDETQYFFSEPGKNTCNGDSGGPAFIARGVVEKINGVTSYGDQNCVTDGVNQRADEPAIEAWIQGMIDQFETASDPCRADGTCDESCNVNNTLVDPDCAPNHCGADGMCVLSCVMPVDPDCVGLDRCGLDGACDPSCPSFDPDCAPLCGADGVCVPTCPTLDPDCAGNCGADGICVTACPSPDPDCTMGSSVASTGVAASSVASTSVSSTSVGSSSVTTGNSSTDGSTTTTGGLGGFGGAGGAESTAVSSQASSGVGPGLVSTSVGVGGSGGAGGGSGGAPGHDYVVTSGCGGCVAAGSDPPRSAALIPFAIAAAFARRRRRR